MLAMWVRPLQTPPRCMSRNSTTPDRFSSRTTTPPLVRPRRRTRIVTYSPTRPHGRQGGPRHAGLGPCSGQRHVGGRLRGAGLLREIADFRRSGQAEHEARRKRRWLQQGIGGDRAAAVQQKRALVIDARAPRRARDAGSHAILSHMLSLQRLGFDVSLAPMDLGPPSPVLAELGITCLTRPWYTTIEEVLARNANAFSLVYLHRADVAAVYGALVRKNQARARVLYSVADLGSLRLERQAAALETPEYLDGEVGMTLPEECPRTRSSVPSPSGTASPSSAASTISPTSTPRSA